MSNHATWRAISCSLATESEKWRGITNDARVMWLQLMLRCDNRGTMEGDAYVIWSACTKRLGWSSEEGRAALCELVAAGLIVAWESEDAREWVHVCDFDAHQPSVFMRKRGHRRTPEPPANQGDLEPAEWSRSCEVATVGRSKGPAQKKKKKEKKREVVPTSLSADADGVASTGAAIVPDDDRSPARRVFDHWCEVDAASGGGRIRGRKLTGDRLKRIEARLREGYSVDDLCDAITAFCHDPFHAGKNSNNTRYTGLVTLLKSGEKVEAGLALAEQAQHRQEASGYVQPQAVV